MKGGIWLSKIEVVKQRDLKDCGACCVSSILQFYNGYVPLEKIRDDTCTGVAGTTAYHIVKALSSYGFDAMGVKVDDIFDENIYLPAIAHVILPNGLQHFVIVYKIKLDFITFSCWLNPFKSNKIYSLSFVF